MTAKGEPKSSKGSPDDCWLRVNGQCYSKSNSLMGLGALCVFVLLLLILVAK